MSHVQLPTLIEEQLFAAPFLSLVDRESVKEFAEWNEAEHPRHPAGSEKGGEFAPVSSLEGRAHGPIDVIAYRAGPTEDAFGRGVFFSGDLEGAQAYESLHPGHKATPYRVKATNAYITQSHMTLHKELFKGKTFQDAVWETDKRSGFKSSSDAARLVEKKMARALKAKGFDALVYIKPPLPAKTEVAILDTKRVKAYAFDPNQPRDEDGKWASTALAALARIVPKQKTRWLETKDLFPLSVLSQVDSDNLIIKTNRMAGSLTTIALKTLRPAQANISVPNVRQMINNWRDVTESSEDKPPRAVKSKRHGLVLLDGHHRVAAALLAGDKTMKIDVVKKEVP